MPRGKGWRFPQIWSEVFLGPRPPESDMGPQPAGLEADGRRIWTWALTHSLWGPGEG